MRKDTEQIYVLNSNNLAVRIGLIAFVIFAVVFGWFSVRWQIGNLLADITSPNQENAKSAAEFAYTFAPGDPLTNWLMASVEKDADPEFTAGFEDVVKLAPNDYRWWIQLGRAYEQAEKPQKAEQALQRAVELAPNYTFPHWQLGNFYLRNDQADEAFNELKIAAKDNPVYREQIFSIAWEYFEEDIEKLEGLLTGSSDVRAGLAKFYAAKERPEKSLEMWNSLNEEEKKENEAIAKLIAQALYDKRFLMSAVEFVNQLGIEKEVSAEKITNGGFEDKLSSSSTNFFRWTVLPVEKMKIRWSSIKKYDGKRSLQISFTGFDKTEINNLYQTVAVKSGEKYQLSFWVKTENLKSAGTPKIELLSAKDNQVIASSESFPDETNDWKEYKINFTVPDDAEGITLRTSRTFCGEKCPIVGTIWYDNFSLQNLNVSQ